MKRKYVWVVALLPLLWFLPLIGVRVQAQVDEPTVTVPAPLKLNCYPVYDDSHSELILNDGRHLAVCSPNEATPVPPTETSVPPTETVAPPTPTSKVPPTLPPPTDPPPTATGPIAPFAGAPACEHPANSFFHSLWNDQQGCHYDHEHGTDAFTDAVAQAFPEFDLRGLLGGVEIGHTNPSSPMENTHKHGGFKWQVDLDVPWGCRTGFESAQFGVDAAVIQYHNFGRHDVEFEVPIHSAVALIRQCVPGVNDPGYIFVTTWQDYGQRLYHYQGPLMPFPNTFQPSYAVSLGPYWSGLCEHCGLREETREDILAINGNVGQAATSKPTGLGERPPSTPLFRLLFAGEDSYQVIDYRDQTHPFTFRWMCSNDGGLTYAAIPGCRYNNSDSRVQEVAGIVPAAWDNTAIDLDPRVGRITAEGFTNQYGVLDPSCTAPGAGCFPFKFVRAYVGRWGDQLAADKNSRLTPERDIDLNGVSSGWIGSEN